MSRILKHLIDQSLITRDKKLKLMFFGDGNYLDHSITDSRHTYLTLSSENDHINTKYVALDTIYDNMSYTFDAVVSTNPYTDIKVTSNMARAFNLPLILIYDSVPNMKLEVLFQMATDVQEFVNVTTSTELSDQLYLYNSHINSDMNNWDDFLNELLFNK